MPPAEPQHDRRRTPAIVRALEAMLALGSGQLHQIEFEQPSQRALIPSCCCTQANSSQRLWAIPRSSATTIAALRCEQQVGAMRQFLGGNVRGLSSFRNRFDLLALRLDQRCR